MAREDKLHTEAGKHLGAILATYRSFSSTLESNDIRIFEDRFEVPYHSNRIQLKAFIDRQIPHIDELAKAAGEINSRAEILPSTVEIADNVTELCEVYFKCVLESAEGILTSDQ